jgi:glycine cleavage system H protein
MRLRRRPSAAAGKSEGAGRMATIEGYNFPDELYYHREHAWVRLEPDGTATIGITDFAQKNAGELVYIDMPFEGDAITQNGTACKIQSAKWIGKLVAPLSGEVSAINEEVQAEAVLINDSPYEKGWFIKIRPSKLEAELPSLLRGAAQILPWLKGEIVRVAKEKAEGEKRKAEREAQQGKK